MSVWNKWCWGIGVSPTLMLIPFPLSSWVTEDGELYSGTSYNFLGSEPIISRNSTHSPLRTEYAIPWLNGKKRAARWKVCLCLVWCPLHQSPHSSSPSASWEGVRGSPFCVLGFTSGPVRWGFFWNHSELHHQHLGACFLLC